MSNSRQNVGKREKEKPPSDLIIQGESDFLYVTLLGLKPRTFRTGI